MILRATIVKRQKNVAEKEYHVSLKHLNKLFSSLQLDQSGRAVQERFDRKVLVASEIQF